MFTTNHTIWRHESFHSRAHLTAIHFMKAESDVELLTLFIRGLKLVSVWTTIELCLNLRLSSIWALYDDKMIHCNLWHGLSVQETLLYFYWSDISLRSLLMHVTWEIDSGKIANITVILPGKQLHRGRMILWGGWSFAIYGRLIKLFSFCQHY